MTTNTTPEAEGEQLKPCPFCGQPPKEWVVPDFYSISCQSGSCPNPSTGSYITRKAAITAWNTRATPPPAATEPGTPRSAAVNTAEAIRDYLENCAHRERWPDAAEVEEIFRINFAPIIGFGTADLHAANRELAEARAEGERLRESSDAKIARFEDALEAASASRDEAVKALEEARDAFPCGFYYDESLPSRIRIMRKQWDSTQQELSRLNQWILSQPDLQARWQKAANEHE